MLKEIFHEKIEKFEIYKDLYGIPFKRDWMAKVALLIQILLIFGSHCNHYFQIYGWKFTRNLILTCSFSSC